MHENRDKKNCQIASEIAQKYHNVPYIWGGDNPQIGLDCSGFVGAILRRVGLIPKNHDNTARGYYLRFKKHQVALPHEGCLVVYGKRGNVSHIMYCLNSELCIGAVGGDSKVTSIEKAKKRNAYVDYRAINYRRDVIAYIDPFNIKLNIKIT